MHGFLKQGCSKGGIITRLQGIIITRNPCSGGGVELVIYNSILYSTHGLQGFILYRFTVTTQAGLFVNIILIVSNSCFSFYNSTNVSMQSFTEATQISLFKGFESLFFSGISPLFSGLISESLSEMDNLGS